jgi:hypothetical protein
LENWGRELLEMISFNYDSWYSPQSQGSNVTRKNKMSRNGSSEKLAQQVSLFSSIFLGFL